MRGDMDTVSEEITADWTTNFDFEQIAEVAF
jgi:hypothetical protein